MCEGKRRAAKQHNDAEENAQGDYVIGPGHDRRLLDDCLWCRRCGAYAYKRPVLLLLPCKGRPSDINAKRRIECFRRGQHPAEHLVSDLRDVDDMTSEALDGSARPVRGSGLEGTACPSGRETSTPEKTRGAARYEALRQRIVAKQKGT